MYSSMYAIVCVWCVCVCVCVCVREREREIKRTHVKCLTITLRTCGSFS